MSTVHDSDNKKRREKTNLYLFIAALFLVAMAFVWSLDSSLVYITFGAAIFFVFLAIWNRPRSTHRSYGYQKKEISDVEIEGNSKTELKDVLKEILRPQKTISPKQRQSKVPTPEADKKRIGFVFFFIFLVFALIFAAIIFSENNTYSDDAVNYYQAGEQFRWEGEYDSAERYYQLALSTDPQYPEALTGYGNVLLAKNQYDQAIEQLDKALEIDPDFENASYSKALVYYYQKKYRQSLDELFQLLERSPSYYDAMVLAGDDYYLQQRYDSAIYWYEAGYSNGVRSAALCHVMAYIYDEKGDDEKAIPLYQEALSYDSTKVDIYTRLGELFPGQDGETYRRTANKLKNEGN